jgi:hypothetical protein
VVVANIPDGKNNTTDLKLQTTIEQRNY